MGGGVCQGCYRKLELKPPLKGLKPGCEGVGSQPRYVQIWVPALSISLTLSIATCIRDTGCFILTPQCLGHCCSSPGERHQLYLALPDLKQLRGRQAMVCQHGVSLQLRPFQLLPCGGHSHAVAYGSSPGFTSSLVSCHQTEGQCSDCRPFFFFFRAKTR